MAYLDSQNVFDDASFTFTNITGDSVYGDVIDLLGGVTDRLYSGALTKVRGLRAMRTVYCVYNGGATTGTATGFELELVTASDAALSADDTVLATSTGLEAALGSPGTATFVAGLHGVLLPEAQVYQRYLGLRVIGSYSSDTLDAAAGILECGLAIDFGSWRLGNVLG